MNLQEETNMGKIKDKVVVIRFTEEDKKQLEFVAEKMGLTNSELIRKLIKNEYEFLSRN